MKPHAIYVSSRWPWPPRRRPLACRTRMTARALSVGDHETADFGGPQSGRIIASEVSAARDFTLDTPSRNCTISSGLNMTGSLRGSRAYGMRSGITASPSVTPFKRYAIKESQRTDDLVQRRP
jgi:hypothetical protein